LYLTIGKNLTNNKRFGVLFQTAPGAYQNFTWYPFMWQGGGDFLTKDGKSAFNSQATIQALKFWQDSINMGVAPRQCLGGGASDAVANLAAGYCAMQNVGIWAIAQLRESAPDFKYGVFRLPTPPGGKYVTIGGGWAFVANSKGENPKAAGECCAWALGSMSPDSVGRMVDWCTKVKSDMPPRKAALEGGLETYSKGFLKVFAEDIYPGTRGEPRVSPQHRKNNYGRDPSLSA
jgi:multiple sugar transport system substrate-binding protein